MLASGLVANEVADRQQVYLLPHTYEILNILHFVCDVIDVI